MRLRRLDLPRPIAPDFLGFRGEDLLVNLRATDLFLLNSFDVWGLEYRRLEIDRLHL